MFIDNHRFEIILDAYLKEFLFKYLNEYLEKTFFFLQKTTGLLPQQVNEKHLECNFCRKSNNNNTIRILFKNIWGTFKKASKELHEKFQG